MMISSRIMFSGEQIFHKTNHIQVLFSQFLNFPFLPKITFNSVNLIFKCQKYQNLELSPGKRSKLLWFESPILRQKLDFWHENWIIWYFLDWNILEYWRKIWNMYLYISMSQSKILSKVNFWTKIRDLEKCGSVKNEFLDKIRSFLPL